MSRIDDLIRELCPGGVTYVELASVATRNSGTALTATKMRLLDIAHGGIKLFAAGNTSALVSHGDIPAKDVYVGPSVIVKSRGYIDFEYYSASFSHKSELWSYTFKTEVEAKFLFYYLKTLVSGLRSLARSKSVKLPQLAVADTDKLRVPQPAFEVQKEIVRMLDTFTELAGELEAELEARKKQYEHYRDTLLTFPEQAEVRWVPMGDLCKISRGASPRPINSFITENEDGVPWIKIGDVGVGTKYVESTKQKISVLGANKSKRIYPGDFILTNSMSIGRPYISKIEGCVHDGWQIISDYTENFNPDFLYHLLSGTYVQNLFKEKSESSSVSNLNADRVRSIKLPVPTLEAQAAVVEVLDKFELYVNDLNTGLPAEIEARRKQYEYYRDKLLTFKEIAI